MYLCIVSQVKAAIFIKYIRTFPLQHTGRYALNVISAGLINHLRCASGYSRFSFQWILVSVTLAGTEARASTEATSLPASVSGVTSVPTARTVSQLLCIL